MRPWPCPSSPAAAEMAVALAHHARQHSAPDVPSLTGTKRPFGARALEESPHAAGSSAQGSSKRVRLAEPEDGSSDAGGHGNSSVSAANEHGMGMLEDDDDGEDEEDEGGDAGDGYDDEDEAEVDGASGSGAAGPQALFDGIDTHLRSAAAAAAGGAGSTGSAHAQPMRMRETKLAGPHYRGVERLNLAGPTPWAARVVRQGKRIRLGHFRTAEAAARAYDKRTLQEKGAGGAVLMNFPSEANAVLAQIAAERARGLSDDAAVTVVSDAPPPFDYNPRSTLHPKTAAALRRHSVPLPAAGGVELPAAANTSAAAAAAGGGVAGHGQPALPGLGSASARTDGAGFAPYAATGGPAAGVGAVDAASAPAVGSAAGGGAGSGLAAVPAAAFDAASGRAVLHGVDGGGGDSAAASGSFARWSGSASAGETARRRTPAEAAASATVSVQHMRAELLACTAAIGESLFQLDQTRATMLRLISGVSPAGAGAAGAGSAVGDGTAAAGTSAAGAVVAPAADPQLQRALGALEAAYGTMCAAAARTAVASSYGSGIAIPSPPAAASANAAPQAQPAVATADAGSGEAAASSAAPPLLHAARGVRHDATQLETSPTSTTAVALAPGSGSLASAARAAGSVDDVAARVRTPTESENADGSAFAGGDHAARERRPTQSEGEGVGASASPQSEGDSELESDADECELCESGPIPPHDSVRCGASEARGCDRAFHLRCAGLASQPHEEWLCASCSEVDRLVPDAAGPVE